MPDDIEMRGKYTAVHNQSDAAENGALRPSLEAAYRSSTSSDDADLDEFDPLNDDGASLKRKGRKHRSESQVGLGGHGYGAGRLYGSRRPWARWMPQRCWMPPRRAWCWLMLLFVVSVLLLLSAGGLWAWTAVPVGGQSPGVYPSPRGGADPVWEESYRRAADMVRQMSLVEKVNITTGVSWMMGMCVGNTGPVERLGFPSLCLQDGPLGLRFADHATAWPAGLTVGATWNKELMYLRGRAHGEEAKGKGVNVVLGPAMGPLGRLPAGGRNWEGFGADPVLQGIAAGWTIRGIQDVGVIATAKHWIGNEQEHYRQAYEWGTPNAISSNIDDRTLHEIYAWPFADSVRAGVGSVMCSYNQVNNSYACQNSKLLNGVLKDELGFQGFVQSDWLAQRSGVASALAGLDMSMPGDGLKWKDGKALWGAELTKSVLNGSVPYERLNDMVTRIVAAWYQMGQDDKAKFPESGPNFSSWTDEEIGLLHPGSDDKTTGIVNQFRDVQGIGEEAHSILARRIAAEGTVMVKNHNATLPLSRQGPSSNSYFIHNDDDFAMHIGIYGEDARGNPKGPNACVDRGCNEGTLASGWGSGAVDYPYLVTPLDALKREFDNNSVIIHDYAANEIPASRLHALEEQDLCIVFINSDGGEGFIESDGIKGDRNDLYSQKGGDELVKTVAARCGRGLSPIIVVVHAIGPVILENWIDLPNVKSVLLAHLPGQESGNAIADVIFGDVNPSGHLPYTIAHKEEDYGPHSRIMRYPNGVVPQQNFSEGIYIDYRHFDHAQIRPRFEFGYGLSYSTFELRELTITVDPTKKTLLPAPRPDPSTLPAPPEFDHALPPAEDSVFPPGFRKLKNYIYPYLTSASDAAPGKKYPAASDPSQQQQQNNTGASSPAGGGPGGNPDLYTVVATVEFIVANKSPVPGFAVPQIYVSFPEGWADPEYFAMEEAAEAAAQANRTAEWNDPVQTTYPHDAFEPNVLPTLPPQPEPVQPEPVPAEPVPADPAPADPAPVDSHPVAAGKEEGGRPVISTDAGEELDAVNHPVAAGNEEGPPPTKRSKNTAPVVDFAPRQLRAWEKIWLEPEGAQGDAFRVSMDLTRRDLSFWDARRGNWVMPIVPGAGSGGQPGEMGGSPKTQTFSMISVREAAAKAAILARQPPWVKSPIRGKTTNFTVMYSPGHKTSRFYDEILNDETHPRYPRVVCEFAARARDGLWLTVISTMAFAEKRTVRSWGTRRVRAAFTEELAARGLNAMGQRVGEDGKRVDGALPRLRGTLNVVVARSALTERYEAVRREAGMVVDSLLAFREAGPAASSPLRKQGDWWGKGKEGRSTKPPVDGPPVRFRMGGEKVSRPPSDGPPVIRYRKWGGHK
ncbi:glycoside hydrolase family 3 protein [Aplosporella prunicola CBS 121167]|uniref:Probable beta-glucosidase E n=1 Tax=Aplosporella prunicola CBS 121167 TaxID=1176127 RepID=A0A6A6AXZ2_9PEZI|nr:glycoside hydrolase family 3 protein [Aplosporella prunicola CBS 121167]KAF2135845.1 glycoside hydrolase family 3 protein [Aplosporella prunicola CBS 121167]